MPLPYLILFMFITVLVATADAEQSSTKLVVPEIKYEKFILPNGLRLIVHEDHKAPIVAINVWYHVGSKNEKPGKTGFAHLFEHLMFNGSENFNDDYFQAMERIGATSLNGTTNNDRTNYFENVPTSAIETALWMESDRMGHLLGVITQEKLDEQRGVVKNEKRQGENRPYGKMYNLISENTYPAGHPYSWTTIGSMEDLDRASLDDVKEWFKTYYGPQNAVIVIAGDIDPKTALEKVKYYFGDIPTGPPLFKHNEWTAKMQSQKRMVMEDQVPQARLLMVWNVPKWGVESFTHLDLVSDVLGLSRNARLVKRLVMEDRLATNVSTYLDSMEIGSQFYIDVTAKPGVSLDDIEKIVLEELRNFLTNGPTQKELERVKTQYLARMIRGLERIGGFGGKSDILAMNEVYSGNPASYLSTVEQVNKATKEQLRQAGLRWLDDNRFIMEINPTPHFSNSSDGAPRDKMPEPSTPPLADFDSFQRKKLSNGMTIICAQRHNLPIVQMSMVVDAGYSADKISGIPGLATMTMNMLDEGTRKRTSLAIGEELSNLGASISASSNLDISFVNLDALKANLAKSLEIYADIILNPSFPQTELDRLIGQHLAMIDQEKSSPETMALRIIPLLLYGNDHPYGNPSTGSGFSDSVKKITRNDLERFHRTWFKPNNAQLIVVGDTTIDELTPLLTKSFQGWKNDSFPESPISTVSAQHKNRLFLIDKPGAIQSIILTGLLVPPKSDPDRLALQMANSIFGGEFTARLNMNLREQKHWSYGAYSSVIDAQGQRPFILRTSVQTDKTIESIAEITRELNDLIGKKPITEEELNKFKQIEILGLPGSWESIGSVRHCLTNIVQFGLPDDYYDTYPGQVKTLDLDQVNAAAIKFIHPEDAIWVIVGDKSKFETGLSKFGFSSIVSVTDEQELTSIPAQ